MHPPSGQSRPVALFVGNALWLDFVNTRYAWRDRPVDLLQSFGTLVDWLAEAGALPAGAARETIARWDGRVDGARVLAEALALRDALRDLAETLASSAGAAPSEVVATAVAVVNRVLRSHVCYAELAYEPVASAAGPAVQLARHMRPTDADPLRVLAPVADSAGELLCGGGDPSLVRRCGNPKCVLYFYDTTKNRHRRFCSPATCGNRVKAAARYRRAKALRRADTA